MYRVPYIKCYPDSTQTISKPIFDFFSIYNDSFALDPEILKSLKERAKTIKPLDEDLSKLLSKNIIELF